MPTELERAILSTLLYADVFDYPLAAGEIWHDLMRERATREQVHAELDTSPWLAARLVRCDGWYAVRGRSQNCGTRARREASSAQLWAQARTWLPMLASLPFVRMISVTGSLAVNNAGSGDDMDLLIVTSPGRVWLVRALVVVVVRMAALLGTRLCPNYVLSERALEQRSRTHYVAHDLSHMAPVYGMDVYDRMRLTNSWTFDYLPHANVVLHARSEARPGAISRLAKTLLERVLGGRPGNWLECREYARKLRKFSALASRAGSAALLDTDHAKGHFNDHGRDVQQAFNNRLTNWMAVDNSSLESELDKHSLRSELLPAV